MEIFAAKQYPELAYMVSSVEVLLNIIEEGKILSSEASEGGNRKGYNFVSLSRSMTAAAMRNNKRWKYGVILDGTQLTEHYSITPHSYSGNNLNRLIVKILSRYDNGDCTITLVNWPAFKISRRCFDAIEKMILEDAQGLNEKKHLVHKTGKRPFKGRTIVDQYIYDVPSGGLNLSKGVDKSIISELLNHTVANEQEERLWVKSRYVDITGAIRGIIVPKNFELPDELSELCEENNYKVIRY